MRVVPELVEEDIFSPTGVVVTIPQESPDGAITRHQESADADHFIGHIHKNHPANLASICEDCHREIHATGTEHVKVKTGKGVRIVAKRDVSSAGL